MTAAGPEPGWYVDPDGADGQRYWNGSEWTEHRKATGLAAPEPVPVRVVKPKRGPLPKPAIIAIAVAFLGGLIWFVLEMQQQDEDYVNDFQDRQRQYEQNLDDYRDNLRDACMQNPSDCGAG